ncbi:MAG: CHAT domain-containing tetratricopeptide repeat protein [Bacteroidia bacterium]
MVKPIFRLLALFFSIFPQLLYLKAQAPDTTLGACYHLMGESFMDSAEYDSAIFYFRESAETFKKDKLWGHYSEALESYSTGLYTIGAYEKAEAVLTEGLAICLREFGHESRQVGELEKSLGCVYQAIGDCEKAWEHLKEGVRLLEKNLPPGHPEIGIAYINLAGCADVMAGYSQAREYMMAALSIFLKKYGENHERVAMTYSNLGWVNSMLGEYDLQMAYYEKSLAIRKNMYGADHPKLITSLINMGAGYYRRGKDLEMLKAAREALAIIQKSGVENHPYLSTTYAYLGNYYAAIGDYTQASHYFEEVIAIDTRDLGTNHPYQIANHYSLGDLLIEKGDLEGAADQYQQGVSIAEEKSGKAGIELAKGYAKMGEIYFQQKNYNQAEIHFRKSIETLQHSGLVGHPDVISAYISLSRVYVPQGNTKKRLSTLLKTLKLNQRNRNEAFVSTGKIYFELGQYYKNQNQLDSAGYYFSLARQSLIPPGSFQPVQQQIPAVREVALPIFLLEIFTAEAELSRTEALRNPELWEKTLQTYSLAAQFADSIKTVYQTREARQFLSAKSMTIYEGGIEAAFALYESSKSEMYVNQAMSFAEKGKYTLLYGTLQENEARGYAGIPEDVLRLERDFSTDLDFYNKKILEEEEKGTDKDLEKISRWRSRILRLSFGQDSLIRQMEINYPDYYNLKYEKRTPSVNDIRSYIRQKNVGGMIEYFSGERNLYIIYISDDLGRIVKTPSAGDLSLAVSELRESIYKPFYVHTSGEMDHQFFEEQYLQRAWELYQRLVLPLGNLPEKLVIIPDGVLGYVPFDALLTQPVSDSGHFRMLPYMIRAHQLAYGFSSALLIKMAERSSHRPAEKKLIAFSPEFGNTGFADKSKKHVRNTLAPLIYSKPEVIEIGKLLGGDIFTDSLASEKRFKQIAPEYQIIHISSHAQLDDYQPMFSHIVFSAPEDSTEDGFLEVSELYHLHINAEMVVLSACETGVGKLIRGEGIASLARGFTYAGSKSMVTTLWSVNDAATTELIQAFYQFLKQGKNKDEALRSAKLLYLGEADNLLAHPYYWSAFVPMGDMSAIETNSANTAGLLAGSIVLLLFTFSAGLWWRRKSV